MTTTTDSAVHAREARVRRALARKGERLGKDRARSWSTDHQLGYMITDDRNFIVAGERWDLTLEAGRAPRAAAVRMVTGS